LGIREEGGNEAFTAQKAMIKRRAGVQRRRAAGNEDEQESRKGKGVKRERLKGR